VEATTVSRNALFLEVFFFLPLSHVRAIIGDSNIPKAFDVPTFPGKNGFLTILYDMHMHHQFSPLEIRAI
jgi:hypothetical protein